MPHEDDLDDRRGMKPEKVTQKNHDGFWEMTKKCSIDFGKIEANQGNEQKNANEKRRKTN